MLQMGKACWHGDDIDSIYRGCPVRKLIWMKAKAGPNRKGDPFGTLWTPVMGSKDMAGS